MKKILAVILSLLLLVPAIAMSVSALEYYDDEPDIDGEMIFDGSACENGAEPVPGEGAIYNFENGISYCCKFDAYVRYPVNAPSDGTYTVKIAYTARTGSNRALDIAVDGERTFIDVEETDSMKWITEEIELTAGGHEFAIYAPTDMDDTELKSVDISFVGLYLTKAAAAEAPAPVTPAPETTAPGAPATEPVAAETPVAAPQTGDIAAVIMLVAAGAAALGITAVSKKK